MQKLPFVLVNQIEQFYSHNQPAYWFTKTKRQFLQKNRVMSHLVKCFDSTLSFCYIYILQTKYKCEEGLDFCLQ